MTRTGERHSVNQDRVVVNNTVLASGQPTAAMFYPQLPSLVAVLDGLGGHPAGEIAAAVAADVIASGSSEIKTESDLVELVEQANRHLYQTMFSYPSLDGMGATVAGVFVTSDNTTIFHVGDSRVYSYTGGHLMRATTDDKDPDSGFITQVLGGSRGYVPVNVHLNAEAPGNGRTLIATDGLFARADRDTLSAAMNGPLNTVPDQLLNVANESGNPDDFSVAIIETNPGDE